jgi:hypothetical protein
VSHSTAPKTYGRIGTGAGALGCLALVGTVCAWLVCAIYAAGNSLWEIYLLKSRGQPAVARVTEYTPETRWYAGRHRRSIRVHLHTVEFNGRSVMVRLPQEIPVGTEIPVLFLPEAPEVVTAGQSGDSYHTLFLGRALGSSSWDGLMCSFGCGSWLFVFVVIAGIEKLARR